MRIYTKELNRWLVDIAGKEILRQIELAYKDYDNEGKIIGEGSEDFSRERYKTLKKGYVYIWDGKKRNKGNYRAWDYVAFIHYKAEDKKAIESMMKIKYQAELAQIR